MTAEYPRRESARVGFSVYNYSKTKITTDINHLGKVTLEFQYFPPKILISLDGTLYRYPSLKNKYFFPQKMKSYKFHLTGGVRLGYRWYFGGKTKRRRKNYKNISGNENQKFSKLYYKIKTEIHGACGEISKWQMEQTNHFLDTTRWQKESRSPFHRGGWTGLENLSKRQAKIGRFGRSAYL